MLTEYEKWLADEKVPRGSGPFHRGYSSLGVDHDALFRRFRETGVAEFPADRMRPCRDAGIARFSFAIPDEAALAVIAAGGPVLECGAGTGYWAYELRQRGADVVACDPDPYSDNQTDPGPAWTEVLPVRASAAVWAHGAGRNLLLVWPSLGKKWPVRALLARDWPTVYYVGEWGGCTADDEFHDRLAELYDERAVVEIPTWDLVHDALYVMDRKR